MTRAGAAAPQRTCLGCRQARAQAQLIRLAWRDGQVVVEPPGRRGAGRGAYVCATMGCWEEARRRRALARALRIAATAVDGDRVTAALRGVIASRRPSSSLPLEDRPSPL